MPCGQRSEGQENSQSHMASLALSASPFEVRRVQVDGDLSETAHESPTPLDSVSGPGSSRDVPNRS